MTNNRHLRILTYHRIADLNQDIVGDPKLVSATPSGFERQAAYLADRYQVVSAKQVLESVTTGSPLPQRAVLITFDDAYCDFKTNAWPILKKNGLSATLFVPTAYPDQPKKVFWWDKLHLSLMNAAGKDFHFAPLPSLPLDSPANRLHSLHRLQDYIKTLSHAEAMATVETIYSRFGRPRIAGNNVLGWDDLRKLAREGVDLGSHTQTHPILTKLPTAQLQAEAFGSYRDLKREIGDVLPMISYPNGNCTKKIAAVFQQEGFKLGFTGQDGHNDLGDANPLLLRRTNITRKTSSFLFRLRLKRLFTYVDRWRHGSHRNFGDKTSLWATP